MRKFLQCREPLLSANVEVPDQSKSEVTKKRRRAYRITVNANGGYMCMNRLVTLSESWKTRLFLHVIIALATDP